MFRIGTILGGLQFFFCVFFSSRRAMSRDRGTCVFVSLVFSLCVSIELVGGGLHPRMQVHAVIGQQKAGIEQSMFMLTLDAAQYWVM